MSLPPELDFDRDREASPARMNRAMTYLFLRLSAATALQPEFETALREIQGVGLDRLREVLSPIFLAAFDIDAELKVLREAWLAGEPFAEALAGIDARIAANLAAVSDQLGAQDSAVSGQLAVQDASVAARLAAIGPIATWAEASLADARAGTAQRVISAAIHWAAQAPVALVDAATIAVDLAAGINFSVTLAGNRILALPTNMKVGQAGRIRVRQDATGGRTLAFATGFRPDDNTNFPVLNAAANAVTVLRYEVTAAGEVTIYGGRPVAARDYVLNGYYSSTLTAGQAEFTTLVAGSGGIILPERSVAYSAGQMPALSTYDVIRTRGGAAQTVGTMTFAAGVRLATFAFTDPSVNAGDMFRFLLTNSPSSAPSQVGFGLFITAQ